MVSFSSGSNLLRSLGIFIIIGVSVVAWYLGVNIASNVRTEEPETIVDYYDAQSSSPSSASTLSVMLDHLPY